MRPVLRFVLAHGLIASMLGVAAPAWSASGQTSHEGVVDMSFPVPPDAVTNPDVESFEQHAHNDDYHANRGSRDGKPRKHQSLDLMAPYGTPVHAAMGGRITWITGLDGAPPSYGYMIKIRGDDGRSYEYVHLGRESNGASSAYASGIRDGVRVERGQHIGYVGCSGSASCTPQGMHLHFGVEDPDVADDPYYTSSSYYHYKAPRLDPYPSLRAALLRGDHPGAPTPEPDAFTPNPNLLSGDVDGDGADDTIEFDPSNGRWTVTTAGDAPRTWATFATRTGWDEHLIADVDADGRDDIVSYYPGNGTWWVSASTGNGFTTSKWNTFATRTGWDTHLVADVDNDGHDDIVSYYPGNGTWWVSDSTGTSFTTSKWNTFATRTGWDTHLVADVDNDGHDDIVSYYPGNGTWWVSDSTGTSFTTSKWNTFATRTGWDTHLVADVDNDGHDDIVSYYPGNGTWWVSDSTGTSFTTSKWNTFATRTGWDTHLVADVDNDGHDDIVSYYPGNGTWWVSDSTGTSFTTSKWNTFATRTGWDTHLVADVDNDGHDDVVSHHAGNGSWWTSRSSGETFTTQRWS